MSYIFICSCLLPPVPQNGSSSELLALGPWPWERSGDSHKQAASQPAATFVPAVALQNTAGKCLENCFFFCLLVFFFPEQSFFSFSWKHIFQTQICPTLLRKSLHFFRQPQGVSSYMECVPYRNPNSLRGPRAGAMLWGGSHPALSPPSEFPVSKGEPCPTSCCPGFAPSPQHTGRGLRDFRAGDVSSCWVQK